MADESFHDVWAAFVEAFDAALQAHRDDARPRYAPEVEQWHNSVIAGLKDDGVPAALDNVAHSALMDSSTRGEEARRMAFLEVRAVTSMLRRPGARPSASEAVSRPGGLAGLWRYLTTFDRPGSGQAEGLHAAGTLLRSLRDLMDTAPGWLKALLIIAAEAAESAAARDASASIASRS